MANLGTYGILVLLTLEAGIYTAAVAPAQVRVIDRGLQALLDADDGGEPVPVIVRLKQGYPSPPALRVPPRSARMHVRRELVKGLRGHGLPQRRRLVGILQGHADKVYELWAINAIAAELRPGMIRQLARWPEVAGIVLDRQVHIETPSLPGESPDTWNLHMIGADHVWNRGALGRDVVVAIMDTGVDLMHPALEPRWRQEGGWFDAFGELSLPDDLRGHGTQVAGIVLGGSIGATPVGVAPRARWIAARVFDGQGEATYSGIHRAMQWLLDPDDDPNTADQPDIVNNSWGLIDQAGQCLLEFEEDVQLLQTAGILVVGAVGNSGPASGSGVSPASYPGVISVGAVDRSGEVPLFSSRGPSLCGPEPFPKLVAPGVDVLTSDLSFGGMFPDACDYATGTSFAAPHVSGALALLIEAFPDCAPEELAQALYAAAVDLGPAGIDDDSGYGLLNVSAAYDDLQSSHLTADFDRSGAVDLDDLLLFSQAWGEPACGPECPADLNGDGCVDMADFNDFAGQYRHGKEN